MGIDAVTPTQQEMGKDLYLQLFVVQAQNQDPMDPIDSDSFLADLAQFSALEQMGNVNTNLETVIDKLGDLTSATQDGKTDMTDLIKSQMGTWQLSELRAAEGMIGRDVTFPNPAAELEGNETFKEEVKAVVLENGVVWLETGAHRLNITDVLRIED